MTWRLPEVQSCCGMPLRTGVYLIAIVALVLNTIVVILNVVIYSEIKYRRDQLLNRSELLMEKSNLTELEINLYLSYFGIGLAYYMAWIVISGLRVITAISLFYGMYNERPIMLRFYLYINVPMWVIDAINSIISTLFILWYLKLVQISFVLLDGYLLLAVRSAFRNMKGLTKFHVDNVSSFDRNLYNARSVEAPPIYQVPVTPTKHCDSCSCVQTPILEATPNEATGVTPRVAKELNFKEQPIIFDQNQLVACTSAVVEAAGESEETDDTVKAKNLELTDVPIIFDQNQFNVGSSPIIEYRDVTNSALPM